jgi:hypothetical protein
MSGRTFFCEAMTFRDDSTSTGPVSQFMLRSQHFFFKFIANEFFSLQIVILLQNVYFGLALVIVQRA